MSRRVLILGARAPVALDHARRFHRNGWEVHVADSIPCRLSAWSSAVTLGHRLAPARFDPRGHVEGLERIIGTHRIDLLLPTCEEALYLSRYRPALPRQLEVAVDDFDKLAELHSKLRFLDVARAHGMPVPRSHAVRTLAQAREWAGDRAVVLKPEFSRFGVHVRLYPQGIPADAPELPPLGNWLVQELVRGRELCSYAIAHRGQLLAHAVYYPRHRLHRSSSYYFDPVEHPAIRAIVQRFVHGTGYHGQVSFDWIEGSDGVPVALECNPRATSGLHLFGMSDALPAAFLGEGRLQQPAGRRAKMLGALMYSAGLRDALRSGALAQWRRDCARADDVITARGDRRCLSGSIIDLGSYARLALRQGCNLREAATRDIEWDGEPMPALP